MTPYSFISPDEETRIVILEIPSSQVVVLQSYFELYEGLGTVRTLDAASSLVCVMTTVSQLDECLAALVSIHEHIPWRSGTPATEKIAAEGTPDSIFKRRT